MTPTFNDGWHLTAFQWLNCKECYLARASSCHLMNGFDQAGLREVVKHVSQSRQDVQFGLWHFAVQADGVFFHIYNTVAGACEQNDGQHYAAVALTQRSGCRNHKSSFFGAGSELPRSQTQLDREMLIKSGRYFARCELFSQHRSRDQSAEHRGHGVTKDVSEQGNGRRSEQRHVQARLWKVESRHKD
jgi:hypothetical protein